MQKQKRGEAKHTMVAANLFLGPKARLASAMTEAEEEDEEAKELEKELVEEANNGRADSEWEEQRSVSKAKGSRKIAAAI